MTAPSLRDRIAELAIIWDRESIEPAEDFANAVMALVADADPADIGGRTLAKIKMLEQQRDAMLRRQFELAEQIAAARAELPEVLDLLRAVVERCVPAVLDAHARPTDDLWASVWRRLGLAHPRTKETTNG